MHFKNKTDHKFKFEVVFYFMLKTKNNSLETVKKH